MKIDDAKIFNLLQDNSEGFDSIQSTDWKWTFHDYPADKNGLKVFSCFACGGGSTMGYKLAGCDVLGCVEIDPKMNELYIRNHKPQYNFLMDIRAFNALNDSEIPPELFNLDILDGSPPCSTFSMAGQRERAWGQEKQFREGQASQTLDDLPFVFIDTVNRLRPKTVIMENVEGILLGNAWQYVQDIDRKFLNIGYTMRYYLCKGEEMGIPQKRHRVFFIAVRNDIQFDFKNLDLKFNYAPIPFGHIKSESGIPITAGSLFETCLQNANETHNTVADVRKDMGVKVACYNNAICWDSKVAPTIVSTASMFRGNDCTKLSTMDFIHAQTFPEDYQFLSSAPAHVQYVCGMSVPPVMMTRIVQRLIQTGVFDLEAVNCGTV